MFANDPTLYGATIPQREFQYQHPFFTPWQQQLPWMNYGRFVPPMFQSEFLPPYVQSFYGNKFFGQPPFSAPYTQGQFPFAHGQFPYTQGQFPFAQGQFPYTQGQFPYTQGQLGMTPYRWQYGYTY